MRCLHAWYRVCLGQALKCASYSRNTHAAMRSITGAVLLPSRPSSVCLVRSCMSPQATDTCGRWMQVASRPGITVGQLQEEFTRWDEQYDSSAAAAGPAKRRLRNDFIRGTYQQLLSNVEAAQSQRLQEAERQAKEVGGCLHEVFLCSALGKTCAGARNSGSIVQDCCSACDERWQATGCFTLSEGRQ